MHARPDYSLTGRGDDSNLGGLPFALIVLGCHDPDDSALAQRVSGIGSAAFPGDFGAVKHPRMRYVHAAHGSFRALHVNPVVAGFFRTGHDFPAKVPLCSGERDGG